MIGDKIKKLFEKSQKIINMMNWYEVNIVDTILLIKIDYYEAFIKYSAGDK